VRVVGIVFAGLVLQGLARRVIRSFRRFVERRGTGPDELSRIDTISRVLRYATATVLVLVGGMLILGELGISIAPILATAGVAGIAIGFGAQSLIRDYLAGLLLLVEDQIRVGDVIEVNGKAGEVEQITLRHVRLRDGDGVVYFLANGEIRMVANRTRSYAYAVIDAAIPGHHDVAAALAAMKEVGDDLRKDPKFAPSILGDMEVWGVDRWELWGMALRGRIKVLPRERDTVRREFLKRLAAAFDSRGIKSP
jgi:small-conductance mechanosensitive channel